MIYLDKEHGDWRWTIHIELPGIDTTQPTQQDKEHVSAIKYFRSDLLYAGTTKGKLYQIKLLDENWIATEISKFTPLPSLYIVDIDLHPSDPDTIIVAMKGDDTGDIWKGHTVDKDWKWTNIS
jgi:ligand-binding sensor domain-containing protein